MDMSGMSGMGGMDMGSDNMFRNYNQELARGYWYIIAGALVLMLSIRVLKSYETVSRLRRAQDPLLQYPTKPHNLFLQCFATATAIVREISHPQLHINQRWLSWLSPPSLGRVLLLCCYWSVLLFMMTNKAVIHDVYYYERIGFRGAWISVTQVPFIYLLASKSNIIGYIAGTSHERLNWFHRWTSRTLLITVTVHGGFFMREWMRADFVQLELAMMPMVKYGIGAWAVLVWTFLSSLSPLRRMAYEIFVLQHVAASVVLLWLLYVHVPAYARYNIWFAIAAIASDRAIRLCQLIYQNLTLLPLHNGRVFGHRARLEAVGDDISVIIIQGTKMAWKPGQHLYLWLPWIGPVEAHPYTIASQYTVKKDCAHKEIRLVVRSHSGFSRRLQKLARKSQQSFTALVAGPYGASLRWNTFETLLLISASTGTSFTLPILESVLNHPGTICESRIHALVLARKRSHVETYVQRLSGAFAVAKQRNVQFTVEIAITSDAEDGASVFSIPPGDEEEGCCCSEKNLARNEQCHCLAKLSSMNSYSSSSTTSLAPAKGLDSKRSVFEVPKSSSHIIWTCGRPDLAEFIRCPVELSGGETSVVVCGGKSLVAKVRNTVTKLSDERAVHKGTGAQGIHLHVEEYSF
ncbi:hypothetical protein F5884DRAFT_153859 [Xylogone sp. PMI_703]|nr:hypothetical protein F5884DRAFT_153859 [Xylogone sp. PMI_703]